MAASWVSLSGAFTSRRPSFPCFSSKVPTGLKWSSLKLIAASKTHEPTKVAPQGDRVLIRLEAVPEKSAGGVFLPKSAVKFNRYLVGEVISVGAEVGEVETGKKVLFSDINAYEVDLGTESRHCFCKAGDLLACGRVEKSRWYLLVVWLM